MIRQLCYLSTARDDLSASALADMLGRARTRNTAAQITGLVAYGGGYWFQILEGPRDNVAGTFARICRDTRHHSLRLLHDDIAHGRDFDHWPLAWRPLRPHLAPGIDRAIDARIIPAILAAMDDPIIETIRTSRAA